MRRSRKRTRRGAQQNSWFSVRRSPRCGPVPSTVRLAVQSLFLSFSLSLLARSFSEHYCPSARLSVLPVSLFACSVCLMICQADLFLCFLLPSLFRFIDIHASRERPWADTVANRCSTPHRKVIVKWLMAVIRLRRHRLGQRPPLTRCL